MQHNAIIQSNVSKEKWQIEVEKVAHKLKINTNHFSRVNDSCALRYILLRFNINILELIEKFR